MDMPISERRQIENEMIFRRLNEKVGDELDELDAIHVSNDKIELMWNDTILISFKCECSDENCEKRIPITLSVYKKIHENRNAFIIKLKHQVEAIEKVIISEENYCVVEKNKSTAEPNNVLNDTSIDNS